jgi:hypothetical protein
MNNETLKNQARSLFVILRSEQDQIVLNDKVRFERLYLIVLRAFRSYQRRIIAMPHQSAFKTSTKHG